MSILKRQVNFSSAFSSLFSIITYNSSVSCSSCIFYFGQKDPMKIPILTLSSVLMKICQIPHAIFQTTSQFFFKFYVTFASVMKYKSSAHFQVKRCILFTNGTNQSGNFLDFFETKNKFFFKFCSSLWYHEIYFVHTFLAETLYTFSKRSLSKSKFGEISPEQSKV